MATDETPATVEQVESPTADDIEKADLARRRRRARADRPPLNPAYAILVGAVLSAVAGLSATFLNIRSSERLSNERDKAAAAAAQQAELRKAWDAKVADLQQQLQVANSRIETLIATTEPIGKPVTVPAPLPSIVVVLPPATPTSAPATPGAVRPVPEPTSSPVTTVLITSVPVTGSTTTTVPPTSTVSG